MIFLIASANQSKPIEFIIIGFIISWKFIWLSNHTQGKNVRNLCINWQADNRIKSYFSFAEIVISEDVKKPLRSATLLSSFYKIKANLCVAFHGHFEKKIAFGTTRIGIKVVVIVLLGCYVVWLPEKISILDFILLVMMDLGCKIFQNASR